MRALERKLLRDAWHYRGQLAAILAVVVCGVALFVTLRSMHGFLRDSRDAFYRDYRFAHVFATVKRAPAAAARAAAALPGVAVAEPRLVYDVTLDVPGLAEPAVGRLVSVPVPRGEMLNELHLTAGRWPLADRPGEVIASAAFSAANALVPGDSIGAIVNGQWRRLRVVGTAVSPEYVYEIGGLALFPDNRRFGVLWMGHDALADAFGMQGAFDDLVVTLRPGASEPEVVLALDRLLGPYGAIGAYGRGDQLSSQFVDGEIEETQVTSVMLPAIFLGVTAFLLHVVLSRLVGTQREQIGVLKAFGYGDATVGAHFLGLALVPIVLGVVLGGALGLWLAGRMAAIYVRFFQFPSARFVPDWSVVGGAVAIAAGSGLVGALGAVRRGVALPPATAMQPEPPPRYRRGVLERFGPFRALSPAMRIVVRGVARRPARTMLSVLALALAVGIVITTRALFDAIDYMKELGFNEVARADVTVTFEGARPLQAVSSLARLPGVDAAEPFRAVPVRFRVENRAYRTAIIGMPHDAELHRVVDRDRRLHRPPVGGLLASRQLATILGVRVGDRVTVEVLEGERPVRETVVSDIADELLGVGAYMEQETLRELVGGAPAASGAWLAVDPRSASTVYAELKRMPAVRAVGVREAELRGFERTVAESFNISLYTAMGFACVIAFGIVYNGARVALSERGRELASLRVLGFSRREVTTMLLGEQALLALLAMLPGFVLAWGFCWLLAVRFDSDLFRMPVVVAPRTYLFGAVVVAVSAALSGLAVRGRVRRLDLVAVLKTRE